MTLKEEAIELVDKFENIVPMIDGYYSYQEMIEEHFNKSKQCALIAVDFAMNSKYSFQPMHGGWVSGKSYYEELKQEIEKL